MSKILLFILVACQTLLFSFEKLPNKYHVTYGNPNAPIKVVEYFSFSCPKCLELFKKDFPFFQERYIVKNEVQWIFHPDPADLLTLQAMICLQELSDKEKRVFWEVILDNLEEETAVFSMKAAMEALNKPLSDLDQTPFLKNHPALQDASIFLKQPKIVTELPTVEVNGKLYDEFPNRKFLEKTFLALKRRIP